MNHIDGVFGGITPNRKIGISFFSERFPIPQSVSHEIKNNKLGEEIDRISKDGSIRQVDCGVIMDLKTAYVVYNWLKDKIDQLEELKRQVEDEYASDNNSETG